MFVFSNNTHPFGQGAKAAKPNYRPKVSILPLKLYRSCVLRLLLCALWSVWIQGEGLRLQSIKADFTNQPLYLPPAPLHYLLACESRRSGSRSGVKQPVCPLMGADVGDYFGPVERPVVSECVYFLPVAGRVCLVVHKVDIV